MAKALGLIGNFKGKLGNTVGYSLKDSNNKQTQGVRVYQPVVRNPKTAAQAEQRAKLAPINATYRALKMIIDRGQEGKAYGNKSRLAWLASTLKGFQAPWFPKGANIVVPAWTPLTKGSLADIKVMSVGSTNMNLDVKGVTSSTPVATVGEFSTAIIAGVAGLQNGDQLTFVKVTKTSNGIDSTIESIVLDTTSTQNMPFTVVCNAGSMGIAKFGSDVAATVIVSREGDNGAHLRSTSSLEMSDDLEEDYSDADAKQAAIESYMSQGANTDWAEESLM